MLRAIHAKTGKPVVLGDKITDFRGDKATLMHLDRVNEMRYGGCRSGKVTARWHDGTLRSVYDGVFDIIVIETNWENSSEGDRQCQ
jgi:hypothetical protein